jgi:restriction system protein
VFESIYTNAIDSVIFNGIVATTDKATGQSIEPTIISVMVSREQFTKLFLNKIDPIECLVGLEAKMQLPFIELKLIEKIGIAE